MKKNHITDLKSALRMVLISMLLHCDFLPCEYSLAEYEESDHDCAEPHQLLELVNYGGCMEGALGVAAHKRLHMESFKMQYGRKYCTTIQ